MNQPVPPKLPGTKPPTKEYIWRVPWFQLNMQQRMALLGISGRRGPWSCEGQMPQRGMRGQGGQSRWVGGGIPSQKQEEGEQDKGFLGRWAPKSLRFPCRMLMICSLDRVLGELLRQLPEAPFSSQHLEISLREHFRPCVPGRKAF